jgi:hypothetical protein
VLDRRVCNRRASIVSRGKFLDRTGLQDMIALLVIAAFGRLSAFVTFGILKSQATATGTDYSLQGSIVGALVATSLLSSIYPKSVSRAAPSRSRSGLPLRGDRNTGFSSRLSNAH